MICSVKCLNLKLEHGRKQKYIIILPIIERKDIATDITDEANQCIKSACELQKVTLLRSFTTESNVYYDEVHLNDKVGIPRLIRHIKSGMHLANKLPVQN